MLARSGIVAKPVLVMRGSVVEDGIGERLTSICGAQRRFISFDEDKVGAGAHGLLDNLQRLMPESLQGYMDFARRRTNRQSTASAGLVLYTLPKMLPLLCAAGDTSRHTGPTMAARRQVRLGHAGALDAPSVGREEATGHPGACAAAHQDA